MEPTIESLLLADFAEVINGKLYVMGAGFTAVQVADFDHAHRFYVAAAFRIPRGYAGQKIPFDGRLETLDAEPLGWNLEGQLETTPTAGERTADATMMFAAPVEVTAKGPMDVVLRFRLAADERTTRFRLVHAGDAG